VSPLQAFAVPASSTSSFPFQDGQGTVESPNLSDSTIQRLTTIFKLLADKSRLKIVLALAQAGQMHVTALKDLLKQSQPAVSHHLTLMRAVGLVNVERRGKNNFYSLASSHVRDLLEQVFGTGDNKQLQFQDWILSFSRKED
jgi:ArsR family transcriptional regulator